MSIEGIREIAPNQGSETQETKSAEIIPQSELFSVEQLAERLCYINGDDNFIEPDGDIYIKKEGAQKGWGLNTLRGIELTPSQVAVMAGIKPEQYEPCQHEFSNAEQIARQAIEEYQKTLSKSIEADQKFQEQRADNQRTHAKAVMSNVFGISISDEEIIIDAHEIGDKSMPGVMFSLGKKFRINFKNVSAEIKCPQCGAPVLYEIKSKAEYGALLVAEAQGWETHSVLLCNHCKARNYAEIELSNRRKEQKQKPSMSTTDRRMEIEDLCDEAQANINQQNGAEVLASIAIAKAIIYATKVFQGEGV